MKQLIEELAQKNKLIEQKTKFLGVDNIKTDETIVKNEIAIFQQEIEYSQLRKNVTNMEKNIKMLTKDIEKHKNLIASLNKCLGGRVNVSEMKQASTKRQINLEELKNKQIDSDNTIINIMQKLRELEQ